MTKPKSLTHGKTIFFLQTLKYGKNQRVRYWQNSKTNVILKRKTQIWTNLRNQVKKKKYFGQKVFELEQLDTSTNDAIKLGQPFAIVSCFQMALNPFPFFGKFERTILNQFYTDSNSSKVFGFCHPSPFSFKMFKPKQKKTKKKW